MPGADGAVRVRYWPADDQAAARETAWAPVDATTNHAHTFTLKGLKRGARYRFVAQGRRSSASEDDAVDCEVAGAVQLPPPPTSAATASFCVLACQDYHRRDDDAQGHKIYAHMLALQPDFAAHCGDTIYYDKPKPWAGTVALARFKWNRFYGLPLQRDFHSQVGTYFVKDDHDTLKNDCWPGQRYGEINWEQGLSLYREQLPLLPGLPYRNVRWGALLEVWFLEGREFRSPNRRPDGPDKTILGKAQWRWLEQTPRRATRPSRSSCPRRRSSAQTGRARTTTTPTPGFATKATACGACSPPTARTLSAATATGNTRRTTPSRASVSGAAGRRPTNTPAGSRCGSAPTSTTTCASGAASCT